MSVIVKHTNAQTRFHTIQKSLSIVIPVFNEEGAITATIEDVLTVLPFASLILVDDGSTDGTAGKLAAFADRARIIGLRRNHGYGFALKRGIEAAASEFVAIMDADGQHRAEDLLTLWNAHDDEDMIVGARGRDSHFTLWRRPGKFLLRLIAEFLAEQKIPDLNSGMRIMRAEAIRRYFTILPNTFSFSTTSTVALMKDGYDVVFQPITVRRRVGTSTVSPKHGLDTIILLIRLIMLFDPLKVFLPLGLINFLTAISWAFYEFIILDYRSFGSTTIMLFLSSLLIFILGLLADQIAMVRHLR